MLRALAICSAIGALASVIAAQSPGASAKSASVPVRPCPTVYAMPGGKRTPPKSLNASIPAVLVRQLAFYSNGYVSLLAPREGWHCSALVAADGGYGMTLTPIGQTRTDFRRREISAEFAFNGPGASLACPYFPEALRGYQFACYDHIPAGEVSTRLGPNTVAIDDPPLVPGSVSGSGGAYPANGVLTFTSRNSAAQAAACTLPPVQHLVCTTVLNDFLSRYPVKK
ncbi:MAG: hypothetical protein ACXVZ3_12935 [Gaiellaceae bacterium]